MRYATSLVVIALLLASGCKDEHVEKALDTACDANGCISLAKFRAGIDGQLNAQVVGYVALVGPLPQPAEYGLARTAADPPETRLTRTARFNVASLSKILTAIAVLRALRGLGLSVDSPIAPFLPPDWTRGPNVQAIKFRHLLTHKAGFRHGDSGYEDLKRQIEEGVQATDLDGPTSPQRFGVYRNSNFGIFRVLLAFMDPSFTDPGPQQRDAATTRFYVEHMRQHVFAPVDITNPSCKPPIGVSATLYYAFPPSSRHGWDGDDWTSVCASGGWYLSAQELYRILLALVGGNTLLTDAEKALMIAGCLGWDCSVQDQAGFVGKNGFTGNDATGGKLWTFAGIFKGAPVIVLVNSAIGADPSLEPNITAVVAGAFQQAGVPRP